eukprot:scaffold1164_cov38-Attheya_sp.AAC.1
MAIVTKCMDTGCLHRYWIPRLKLRLARQKIVLDISFPDCGNGLKLRMSIFLSLDSACSTTKPSASRGINAPAWSAAVKVLRAARRCA